MSEDGLIHHCDRGVQNLSIRYTDRLAQAGLVGSVGSVGSVGDSYDNALAESVNGLFKAEVIRRSGPWRNADEVEFAVLEWVEWFNNRRLLEPLGPPSPAASRTAMSNSTTPQLHRLDLRNQLSEIPGAVQGTNREALRLWPARTVSNHLSPDQTLR
jgi:transposase InsO family protein